MQSFQQLLDAMRDRAGSDRKAAPLVGVKQASFSEWRRGMSFPDDEQAMKIADALQLPPAYVLAIVRADRTSSRKARAEWLRIAERFAAVVLISASAGILPAPAASHAQAPGEPCVLCQMSPCRCRRPIRQLGRTFGSVLQQA